MMAKKLLFQNGSFVCGCLLRSATAAIGMIVLPTYFASAQAPEGQAIKDAGASTGVPDKPKQGGKSAPSIKPAARPLAKAQRVANAAEMQAAFRKLGNMVRAGKREDALAFALATLARAKTLFRKTDGYVGVSHRYVGDVLMRMGRAAEAAKHYLPSLIVISKYRGVDHKYYQASVTRLTRAWIQGGSPAKALSLYAHILKGAGTDGTKETFAHSEYRVKYGKLLRRRGRLREAESQYRQSLAVRRRLLKPDDYRIGYPLSELGGVLRVTGRLAEAEKHYLAALKIMNKNNPKDANVGILLDNLGNVYSEWGRKADAERVQRKAVAIFESALGPDHLTTGVGIANLAVLYYQQGRRREARPLFDRALGIYRAKLKPTDLRIGILMDNFAGLNRIEGKLETALKMLDTSLRILRANLSPDHPEIAKALSNLAIARLEMKDLEGAEKLLREALAINEKTLGKSHPMIGIQLGSLGDVLLQRKQLKPAKAALERAVRIIDDTLGPYHEKSILALRLLSGLSIGLKDYEKALDYSRRAVKAEILKLERNRVDPESSTRLGGNGGAFSGFLYVSWRLLELNAAGEEDLAREAFEVAQWTTLSHAGHSVLKIGARFGARKPELAELARERQDLAQSWRKRDEQLITLISAPPRKRNSAAIGLVREKLSKIQARLLVVDKKLAAEFPAFEALSKPKPLAVDDAQKLLRGNEALVQYVRQGPNMFAGVLTAKTLVWRKLALSYAEITEKVQALRCGLDPSEWIGEKRPLRCLKLVGRGPDPVTGLPFDLVRAHELYEALLEPFSEIINGKHLLIVPSGSLSSLPFQVLVTKAPKTFEGSGPERKNSGRALVDAAWLVHRHALSVLPSVAALQALRKSAKASRAEKDYFAVANPLLVGADGSDFRAYAAVECATGRGKPLMVASAPKLVQNAGAVGSVLMRGGHADPTSVRRLSPLADTRQEVCSVGRRFSSTQTTILLGEQATETALKERDAVSGLSSFKILHFATHGLVSGEIKGLAEPALVLTPPRIASAKDDGLLTASEVAALRLDAEWVILSACNTAAGETLEAEALSGLARSFFYAGARSLMVSHWPVQSHAAVKLTTSALRILKHSPGVGRAQALRLAMLAILRKPARPSDVHPHVWAPFIVVGEAGRTRNRATLDAGQRPPSRLSGETGAALRRAAGNVGGFSQKIVPPPISWRGRVFSDDR